MLRKLPMKRERRVTVGLACLHAIWTLHPEFNNVIMWLMEATASNLQFASFPQAGTVEGYRVRVDRIGSIPLNAASWKHAFAENVIKTLRISLWMHTVVDWGDKIWRLIVDDAEAVQQQCLRLKNMDKELGNCGSADVRLPSHNAMRMISGMKNGIELLWCVILLRAAASNRPQQQPTASQQQSDLSAVSGYRDQQ